MSLIERVRARSLVLRELQAKKSVDDPTFDHPALEYAVGRYVTVVGDPGEELTALLTLLEDQGYLVQEFTDDDDFGEDEFADTAIIYGLSLTQERAEQLASHALWSVVFCNCEGLEDLEYRGLVRAGDLYILEKYGAETARALRLNATVRQRTKTADSWEYQLSLNDSEVLLRATGKDEFANGELVAVSADHIAVAGETVGLSHGRVTGPDPTGDPDSLFSLLSRSEAQGLIVTGVETATVDYLLERSGLSRDKITDAHRILKGFTGEEIEAITLLRDRLGEQADSLMGLPVTRFSPVDEGAHRVVGVVLEPDTPYGKRGAWFSKETIKRVHDRIAKGALNHRDAPDSDVMVVASMLDTDGEFAMPGSWLVECQVSDGVFSDILKGVYQGFSVKGTGLLAGAKE